MGRNMGGNMGGKMGGQMGGKMGGKMGSLTCGETNSERETCLLGQSGNESDAAYGDAWVRERWEKLRVSERIKAT